VSYLLISIGIFVLIFLQTNTNATGVAKMASATLLVLAGAGVWLLQQGYLP